LHIASAGWPEHNFASGFERNDPFLLDEVAAAACKPVGGSHKRLSFGLVEETFAEVRMRDLDQGHGPLPHGFAEQVGDPELGHHFARLNHFLRGKLPSPCCEKRQRSIWDFQERAKRRRAHRSFLRGYSARLIGC
jgi:hypothetical protein